jgi:Uma2 family endonuclease
MLQWADICADPRLQDLPFKVETNRFNQIVMSPASSWHGGFEYEIGKQIELRLSGGRVIVECAINTSDGVRVADVAWISKTRLQPHKRAYSLPVAPEICVEVLSESNSREQMIGKMQLYFAAGAQEVWLCTADGEMEFFHYSQTGSIEGSRLCPGFPKNIEWE